MRPHPRRLLTRLLLCCTLAATGGCTSLGYYGQAVRGQLEILSARRPIARVLEDPAVAAETKRRLERVTAMREFARTALGLDRGGSFGTYADLHRDFVVWNVFATPELSLVPLQSCFPVAGCLSYRGFFRLESAAAWAATLRAAGDDVYVGGVTAYSTLGWFDDPVLNTWLGYDPPRLAGIVFHELAHGLIYAADDSEFNESFATAVAQIGYARWQAAQGLSDDGAAAAIAAREDALVALLLAYRERLAALYASGRTPAALRAGKQQLFAGLADDYAALKRGWGGDTRYDAWMGREMNNAKLASVAAYHALVPAFRALYASCDADLPRFYAQVRALAALPRQGRAAALREAAAGACAAR